MTLEAMIQRQQQILNTAREAGRDLTDAERAEWDTLQRSIDAANKAKPKNGARGAEKPEEGSEGSEGGNPEDTQRAIAGERARITEISALCREFGVDPDEHIRSGATIDAVRTAVLEHVRTHGAPLTTGVNVTDSAEDKFRRAASDSLLLRGGLTVEKPEDGAREMRGMSLRDLAIECLQADGCEERNLNRLTPDDLFSKLSRSFYNPEAAFPSIMDQTIEKSYKEGHKKVAVTFDRWVKTGSLKDFKTHDNYYIAGPVGEFLEVPENGELKHDVFTDAKLPTRKLRTYGRQFTLSRKAFIDDDISLVTSIPSRYAASARKTQNKQVYEALVGNPTIYDGLQLFGGKHKNLLAEGTGITQEAMQTMIMALANQQDQFGQAIIINPATLIVPSGMKFDMYTLFNSPTINTTANTQAVNPLYQYRESIEVVEDPTINALCGGFGKKMPWFLVGSAGDTDFMQMDYLNGDQIPKIRRMEAPGTLGFIWDIYLDWGLTIMDYRGCVKNPGIEVDTKLKLAE